jgi:hypothetical protein
MRRNIVLELTPQSKIILDKPVAGQLVKNFPFFTKLKVVVIFIKYHHWIYPKSVKTRPYHYFPSLQNQYENDLSI